MTGSKTRLAVDYTPMRRDDGRLPFKTMTATDKVGSGSSAMVTRNGETNKADSAVTMSEANGNVGYGGSDGGFTYTAGGGGGGDGGKVKGEVAGEKDGDDSSSLRCSWGSVDPDCCQTFLRPAWFLVCLSWAGAVQGMVVNGFVNVVISTLERRFEINSTESGAIASCYDIAAVFCLIPVSYFGGRGRKPLYLAVGMLVLGVGSFVFSIPHFTTDLYEVGEALDVLCTASANATTCSQSSVRSELSNYKYVFFLGQLLHGCGASPLYTLGVTYLDENLPVRSSALYTGIFYTFAIFGPGIGYLAGGAFLSLYTDLDKLDADSLDFTNDNPRWVGAWWVGFLISGTIAILVALPIFGFPRMMPGSEKYKSERGQEVYQGKKPKTHEAENQPLGLQHIVASVKILLTNPTFMFLNLAAASEGIVVSGFSTFGPKFIEFQFGLSSSTAAQYAGLIAIPGGGGGTLLGGWLVKRFNMKVRTILKFCVIATMLTVCCCLIFLVSCDNVPFAGISSRYQNPGSNGQLLDPVQMDHTCNTGCGCSLYSYQPVCGRDGVMYYSPCYAGCNVTSTTDVKKHTNCSCVTYNYTAADHTTSELWQVQDGKCSSDCPYLIPFLAVFCLLLVGTFITAMPALSASLRCVPQDQRSFALGIQWIIARCLGSIPGPILFGKMFDVTCLVWQQSCQGDGACFYYDNLQMSHNLLGLGLGINSLTCLAFLLSLVFYKPSGATSPEYEGEEVEVEAAEGVAGASRHTSMTTITQPPTPSSEHLPSITDAQPVGGNSLKPLPQNSSRSSQDGQDIALHQR